MKRLLIYATAITLTTITANAADWQYVVPASTNGTVRIIDAPSQSPTPPSDMIHKHIVADPNGYYGRLVTPAGVPLKYYAWNGSAIVEASQIVKDKVDAEIAAKAALVYPDPAVVVVELNDNGDATGRTFRGYIIDGVFQVMLNSASPARPWPEQKGDFATIANKRKKAKDDWHNNSGHGQLQNRIEALEAAMNELIGIE